jgi:WD40 repeat protein
MKRPWSQAEKALVLMPIPLALVGLGFWQWRRNLAPFIPLERVSEVAFSPDGRHIAALTERKNRVYSNAGAIFNAKIGELEARLQVPDPTTLLRSLNWAPDSSRLATAQSGLEQGTFTYKYLGKTQANYLQYISIWQADSGRRSQLIPYSPPNEYTWAYIHWARDGRLWGTGPNPSLFDLKRGQRIQRFGPPTREVPFTPTSSFNTGHTLLSVASYKGGVSIYEIPSGRLIRTIATSASPSVTWSRDGDVLAIYSENKWVKGQLRTGLLRILDARTGRTFQSPPVLNANKVIFGSNYQIAINEKVWRVLSEEGMMKQESTRLLLWDYRGAQIKWQATRPDNSTFFEILSLSPDGHSLLVRDSLPKPSFTVWDFATGKEIWRQKEDGFKEAKWAPDSKRVALYGLSGINIVRLPD